MSSREAGGVGRDLVAIVVLGLAARLTLLALMDVWGAPRLWEYDDIATNVLNGRGFVLDVEGTEYRAFTTPGWPLLLAALLLVGDYRLVQCLQILLGLSLGVAVYLVVRTSWARRAALLAGAASMLHPGLVYYSVMNSDPLPLNALIVFLIAAALLRLGDHPSPSWAVVPGTLIGMSLFTRGTTVLLLPVAAVWLVFVTGWRRATMSTAVVVVVAGVWVAPWILRNMIVLDAPVMTSTAGEMLWWGNNPDASGGVEALDGSNMAARRPSRVQAVLRASPNELVHDRAFKNEAFGFMRSDPGAAASLWLRKFVQFWWFGPFYGKEYPVWYLSGYKPLYALELMLAAAGIVIAFRSRQHSSAAWLFVSIPLAISIFQSLFYVQGRHRWMVESFLIVFASVAAAAVIDTLIGAEDAGR